MNPVISFNIPYLFFFFILKLKIFLLKKSYSLFLLWVSYILYSILFDSIWSIEEIDINIYLFSYTSSNFKNRLSRSLYEF